MRHLLIYRNRTATATTRIYSTTSRRCLHVIQDVGSHGTIIIEAQRAKISIASAWQDFCSLPIAAQLTQIKLLPSENLSNVFHVQASNKIECLQLDLKVPEYINIDIQATHLELNIPNKTYGNLHVACDDGLIKISKSRGDSIRLLCGKGNIVIDKGLEGNIITHCMGFTAKMINATEMKVLASGNVHMDAVYGNNVLVDAASNVTIDLMKGFTKITSKHGHIDVKNIDGTFDILAEKGDVTLQINGFGNDSPLAKAEARQGSAVVTISGLTQASVDLSVNEMPGDSCPPPLQLDTELFEGQCSATRAVGLLKPSSKDSPNTLPLSSGKINTQEAARQSLDRRDENKNTLLVVDASKSLRFETLSWMDVIRRRHGLD